MTTRLLATRRRPTTARIDAEATNVDDDEATNGRRYRPMADVNDDEVASDGRHRPTTAMTVANAASVNDDEVVSGGAAVPSRPRPSLTRPTSMTTRSREAAPPSHHGHDCC